MQITCLIANKNYGNYVENAIKSCLNQTLAPTCVCIIDDGSTDNSWDVISKYTSQNQRQDETVQSEHGPVFMATGSINDTDIFAVKLPKSVGPAEARNIGIELTKQVTDIYAMIDADDAMLPQKLEICVEKFKNESIGLVYANYYLINHENKTKLLEIKEPFDIFRIQQECIVHSGFLVRKDLLEKVKNEDGYYDRTMRTCEDWALELKLLKHCTFYHIPEALTEVLVHNNNSTNSVDKKIWQQNWNRISQKYLN